MTQLITAVIAIVIMVLLAIAAIWFGGSTFVNNSGRVDLATYENGAAQIETALSLYYADNGVYPSGTSSDILASLVTLNYLDAIPAPADYSLDEVTGIQRPLTDLHQCYMLNFAAGVTHTEECPACSDDTKGNYPGCTQ